MSKLLFSTDTDSGLVSVLDLSKKGMPKVTEIPVGNGPRGPVRFISTGRGFVANHAGDTLSEIDAYSLRENSTIKVGVAPIGCAITPNNLYALTSITGDNTIAVVDLEKREKVNSCVVGREPRHMDITPDGKYAYVAVSGGDYIGKIDISNLSSKGKELGIREIKRIYLGKNTMPYSLAISPNGKYALAANNQQNFVTILNLEDDTILHEVNVGTKGARGSVFADESDKVFVTIEDSSEIVAIDVKKGQIVKRIAAGPGPRGIILDSDSNTLFASQFARTQAKIREVDVTPNSIGVFPLGRKEKFAQLDDSNLEFSELHVGAGPCSVSIFTQ